MTTLAPSPTPPAVPAGVPAEPAPPETRSQRQMRQAWLLGAAGVTLMVTVQNLRDPDVWWHLAAGNLIRAHGIPAQEPFTFAGAPNPWVGQQWGYEVALSWMFSVGPWLAMLAMGLVATLAFVVAVRAMPRALRVPGVWLAGSVVLSSIVAGTFLGVRGQVITLLGSAIVLWVMARWRDGSTRAVWLLPPLFLVWANLHAGFIYGFALCVLVAATVAVRREPRARFRPLLVALVVGAAATLANPAGVHLFPYIASTFTNPTLTQGITEWQSPDFHLTALRVFEVLAVLLVALWIVARRVDPVDVVLGIAALAASLQAQRNVALFAVVATPQVARYGWQAWYAWTARPRIAALARPRPALPALLMAGAVVVVVVVAHVVPISRASAVSADQAKSFPVASTDYVAAHHAGERIYSLYEWGGYLAHRFPTQHAVYIYGESAVFGSERMERYLDIHLLRGGWRSELQTQRMTVAIVPTDSQEVTALLEIGWQTECRDSVSESVVMHAGSVDVGPERTPPDPRSAPSC